MKTRWYKQAVVYQIYPRSFCDSNKDGIGDIQGIISKLDYLKNLGIDALWISPMYKSPDADFGYDISDYRSIDKKFGTMDDFDQLVKELKKRNIKLIMDLVVNHTSDQHKWFVESKKSIDNDYRDYYIWRKGKGKDGKKPPNNWTSRFSGPAWTYDEKTKEWYLHLYAPEQPDLNWNNPVVRKEIADVCNFWLKKGVDGFRCDVITNICKNQKFPNGKYVPILRGDEHFTFVEPWHVYIKQLAERSWNNFDTLVVAEGTGATFKDVSEAANEVSKEFDSFITFEHLEVDFLMSFLPVKFKLVKFKKVLDKWQTLSHLCWPTLYFENHDQPRSVSRYIKNEKYHTEGAKMLCVALHMQRGTPYVYQGQEIGMTNCTFVGDENKDTMTKTVFKTVKKVAPILMPFAKKVMRLRGRDNARTPMQWTNEKYAGFSRVKPWIKVNPNKDYINAESQINDPDSIYNFYKRMIELRNGNMALLDASYCDLLPKNKNLYVIERRYKQSAYISICNFSDKTVNLKLPKKYKFKTSELIIGNYKENTPELLVGGKVRPYEARVYQIFFE